MEREKRLEVLEMLPEDGSPVRWTPLEREARGRGMSLRTLRKNLDKLEAVGLVRRIVDPGERPPAVYYHRALGSLLPETLVGFIGVSRRLEEVGGLLAGPGPLEAIVEADEAMVRAHLRMMAAVGVGVLYGSLGGKGPYELTGAEVADPAAGEELATRIHVDVHDLADELLDLIIRPWVHGLLDAMMVLDSTNKSLLDELREELTLEAMPAADRLRAVLARLEEAT